MARATNSLPVPVSPRMSTVESVVATFVTCARTRRRAGDEPTIDSTVLILGETGRSEEHTSELQSRPHLVCRLLLEKKKKNLNKLRVTRTHKNAFINAQIRPDVAVALLSWTGLPSSHLYFISNDKTTISDKFHNLHS